MPTLAPPFIAEADHIDSVAHAREVEKEWWKKVVTTTASAVEGSISSCVWNKKTKCSIGYLLIEIGGWP